jgi:hypothetical protein
VLASSAAHPYRCTLDAMRIKLEPRATVGAFNDHLKSLLARFAPLARIRQEPPAATLADYDRRVYETKPPRRRVVAALIVSSEAWRCSGGAHKIREPFLSARKGSGSGCALLHRPPAPAARPSPPSRGVVSSRMRAKESTRKLREGIGNIPCSPARNRPRNPCRGAGPRNPARP